MFFMDLLFNAVLRTFLVNGLGFWKSYTWAIIAFGTKFV